MRRPMKHVAALAVGLLALSAAACNKGPAREALAEADRALAEARPEIERYLPERLARITAAADEARANLEQGRYTEALRIAQDLPVEIQAAVAAAAVARNEQTARWQEVAASLPALVQTIEARFAELDAAQRLPRGVDAAALAAARADLDAVTRAWSEAVAAFEGGDVPRALRAAGDVQAKAAALAGTVGVAAAPAPAP